MPRKPPKELEDATEIGRRILKALDVKGLSQTQLEKDSGMHHAYVSRIIYGDRGSSIKPAWVFSMADALGVRDRWLWLGEGPMYDESTPPKTNRERGIAMARLIPIPEWAIEPVVAEHQGSEWDEQDALWWLTECKRMWDRMKVEQARKAQEKAKADEKQQATAKKERARFRDRTRDSKKKSPKSVRAGKPTGSTD